MNCKSCVIRELRNNWKKDWK